MYLSLWPSGESWQHDLPRSRSETPSNRGGVQLLQLHRSNWLLFYFLLSQKYSIYIHPCRPKGRGHCQAAGADSRRPRTTWRTGSPRTKRVTRGSRKTWSSRWVSRKMQRLKQTKIKHVVFYENRFEGHQRTGWQKRTKRSTWTKRGQWSTRSSRIKRSV